MAVTTHEQPRVLIASAKTQHRLGQIGIYALLMLGAAFILVPLYWMIATSLKAETKLFVLPPHLIPDPIVWRNYIDVWRIQPFTGYFLNTIFVTVLAMGGEILSCALVAYGFARFR